MAAPVPPPPKVPGLTGLTVLARGGYATVYRAEQESVGRDVAVKVENRTLENDRDRRRFLREARAAGRMSSHPHVVDLFDAGVTIDGHPYLIMELCDGSYLERMRTSPLGPHEAREVGIKIADALTDAHSLGVLHRDVKPANILYSRFGEPALADFGLAILAETRDVSITLDTLTPAYAPPEMFRAAPPSPAADVYALCATLYALMRGKPPRWQEDRNPSLVSLVDMFHQPIPDLPGVPPDLMHLLRAGMANDEQHRPTALQLRDALDGLRLAPEPAHQVLIPPLGAVDIGPAHWSSAGQGVAGGHASPGGHAGPGAHPGTGGHGGPGHGGSGHAGSGGHGGSGHAGQGGHAAPAGHAAQGWPSGGDDDDTVPHGGRHEPGTPPAPPAGPKPGKRRRLWWSFAAGAAALAATIALLIAYVPQARPGFVTPSKSADVVTAPCGLALDSSISCPRAPECYDDVTVKDNVARAQKRDCNGGHKWEVFALGTLPTELKTVDYKTVDKDPTIDKVCSPATLLSVGGNMNFATWQLKVLPPTPEELSKGDRTYRCLAGSGAILTSPQLKFPR